MELYVARCKETVLPQRTQHTESFKFFLRVLSVLYGKKIHELVPRMI